MENNEKYIIDRIRSHREDMDLDELWSGISPHIPNEKKKDKMVWWIFANITVAVIIAVGFIYLYSNYTTNDWVHSKPDGYYSNASEGQIGNSISNVYNDALNPRLNAETETASIETKQEKETILSASYITTDLNYGKEITEKESIKVSTTGVKLINILSNAENAETKAKQTRQDFDGFVYINEESEEGFVQAIGKNDHEKVIQKGRLLIDPFDPLDQRLEVLHISSILDVERVGSEMRLLSLRSASYNRWSSYLFAGGSMVNRKLMANSIELQAESERRNETVDVLGGWEIEGGIGFRIKPKLKVMIGLNYSQIHERADFESQNLVDFEIETNSTIYRQDGTIDNLNGVTKGQGIRIVKEKRYNQLRMLQIPIKASYEVLAFDKLKMNLGVLASYSILQKYKGYTSLSASRESYNLELDLEGKFRSGGAISYGLYLEGISHLSRMTDLTFSLGYRQTKKINSDQYLIDQQYNSISLTSGLCRRF